MALYIGIKNLIGKGAAWLRSKWTTIVTQLLAEFRYRVAGGSDNALLPERNGMAVFKKVYGKTVKFNQLVQNGDFSDGTTGWSGVSGASLSVANNICTATMGTSVSVGTRMQQDLTIKANNKYYFKAEIYCTKAVKIRIVSSDSGLMYETEPLAVNSWNSVKFTGISSADGTRLYIYLNYNTVLSAGDEVKVRNINFHDLTAAEIDTLTTVEQVEAWLALNVGAQDYYPYDEGSLVSFKGSALQVKKDGAVIDEVDLSGAYINVWDEEWELGVYNISTGEKEPYNTAIRCVNKIAVVPNTEYYATVPAAIRVIFYKSDGTYLTTTPSNGVLTIPSNAYYMTFHIGNTTEYAHNICINVSNANINGTYYPHALQSAGSVTDEDTATELTKKLRQVTVKASDLVGAGYSGGTNIYRAITNTHFADGAKHQSSQATIRNAVTSLFGYSITAHDPYWIIDMRIGLASNGQLAISNNSFTSLAEFQALCPFDIIYEVNDYITIPHDTPMQYAVDKHSTEELLVPASVAGEPTSTAIVADIEYQAK